jgi:hypothetical protein
VGDAREEETDSEPGEKRDHQGAVIYLTTRHSARRRAAAKNQIQ